jgi:hypothetical protein
MITHHDQELSKLKDKLLTMASLTEAAITQSIKALVDRDNDIARQVKIQDDQIDQLEVEMDEMAIALLSKAPLARDLRFIIVAMKISHDLERVGDEACGQPLVTDARTVAALALEQRQQDGALMRDDGEGVGRPLLDRHEDLEHQLVARWRFIGRHRLPPRAELHVTVSGRDAKSQRRAGCRGVGAYVGPILLSIS